MLGSYRAAQRPQVGLGNEAVQSGDTARPVFSQALGLHDLPDGGFPLDAYFVMQLTDIKANKQGLILARLSGVTIESDSKLACYCRKLACRPFRECF
jgi:hypothetical protein